MLNALPLQGGALVAEGKTWIAECWIIRKKEGVLVEFWQPSRRVLSLVWFCSLNFETSPCVCPAMKYFLMLNWEFSLFFSKIMNVRWLLLINHWLYLHRTVSSCYDINQTSPYHGPHRVLFWKRANNWNACARNCAFSFEAQWLTFYKVFWNSECAESTKGMYRFCFSSSVRVENAMRFMQIWTKWKDSIAINPHSSFTV